MAVVIFFGNNRLRLFSEGKPGTGGGFRKGGEMLACPRFARGTGGRGDISG